MRDSPMQTGGTTFHTPGSTQHLQGDLVMSTLAQAPQQRTGLDVCKATSAQCTAPSTHAPESWRVPQGPTEVMGHELPAGDTMSRTEGCGGNCGCGGTCGKKSSCDCLHEVDYKIPGMGCGCGTEVLATNAKSNPPQTLAFASSYFPILSFASTHYPIAFPLDGDSRASLNGNPEDDEFEPPPGGWPPGPPDGHGRPWGHPRYGWEQWHPPERIPPRKPDDEPPPDLVCGPDITDPLVALIRQVRDDFILHPEGNEYRCSVIISGKADKAWDIRELFGRTDDPNMGINWYLHNYREKFGCAKPPPCHKSVWVRRNPYSPPSDWANGHCWYSGSVNYLLWGAIFRLCNISEGAMHFWLQMWKQEWTFATIVPSYMLDKVVGPLVLKRGDPNLMDAHAWAKAGYRGWPKQWGPSPQLKEQEPCRYCMQALSTDRFSYYWGNRQGLVGRKEPVDQPLP